MNTGITLHRLIAIIFVFSFAAFSLCYAQFAGGDGSEAYPYQVSSVAQLNSVRDYPNAHFVQMGDLDLNVEPYNSGAGWNPLGSELAPFTGTYNGNGHKLLNLFINRPQADYQGLFGYVSNASLSALSLQFLSLGAASYAGALVGAAWNSDISNVDVSGTVYGQSNLGGLAGSLEGFCSVNQCQTNVKVNGTWSVGALLGYNKGGSEVLACYSKGQVYGTNAIGGLIGTQGASTVSNSYSFATVTGVWGVGGLVGVNDNQCLVQNCYSTGLVSGSYNVGGLVGRSIISQTNNSYWNTQTSGQSASAGGAGRIGSELQYPYADNSYVSWDFASIWQADTSSTVNGGYPYLLWEHDAPGVQDLALVYTPGQSWVNLSWMNAPGATPTYYKLYRNGVWINTVEGSPAYQDMDLDHGVLYSYSVSAVYPWGESELCTAVNVTVYLYPLAASCVFPANGAIDTELNLQLIWQGNSNTDHPEASGYFLNIWNQAGDLMYTEDIGLQSYHTLTDTLAWGTTYTWQVLPYIEMAGGAYLYALDCPIWSFSTVFAELIGQPVNLVATVQNHNNVTLSWDLQYPDRSLQNYNIYRNGGFLASSTEPYYTDELLQDGYYIYYVTAVFETAVSDPSNTVEVQIYTVYPAQEVMADLSGNEVALSWMPSVAGLEQGYNIWRLNAGQESYESGWTVIGSGISEAYYTDTNWNGLPDGAYRWAVKAMYVGSVFSAPAFSNELIKVTPVPVINVSPGYFEYSITDIDTLRLQVEIGNTGSDVLFWNSEIVNIRNGQNRFLNINLNPSSGEIAPGSSMMCQLYIASILGQLGANNYELIITSNDPVNQVVTIPINIEVSSPIANIPDANFRMAINEHLGMDAEYLPTIADLQGMSGVLEAYASGIGSIEGAQYLSSLEGLQLGSNQISNLGPLNNLSNLSLLSLVGNQISNLGPLANLSNLHDLSLSLNQISDISPLSGLSNLQSLGLYNNLLSNLSSLSTLVNLQSLDISNNQISDLSPLSYLTNLSWLSALNNQISNLSPLANLTNLQGIQLNLNHLSNISALNGLVNLQTLDLNYNQISDLSPLTSLVNLHSLWLNSNQITDLSPLSGLNNLNNLYMAFNQIDNINAMGNLSNLIQLDLHYNQISDLSPLADLAFLQGLALDGNPLSKESMLLTQSWSLPYVASSFMPIAPCYPSPSRNQQNYNPAGYLQWAGNYYYETVSFELWLGSSPTELVYIGTSEAIADTLYGYSLPLSPNTEYYWRIKAITGTSTVWGGLWHFTTGEVPEFAGGSGTEIDPYLVATAEHLNNVRNHLDAFFLQTADIDLGVAPWNEGEGWMPLGSNEARATGSYNGNGHIVSNLFINRPAADHQGLWGYVDGFSLSNLGVDNLQVTGKESTGGMIGTTRYSEVDNCYAIGSVTGYGTYNGGFVGINGVYSTITNCYAMGSVSGSVSNIGGFAGYNHYSSISNCYANGTVSGYYFKGGFVGDVSISSSVNSCYWNTETSAYSYSAGGIGLTTAEMTYPYAANAYVGWNWANTWAGDLDHSQNSGYPYLQWQAPAPAYYPPQRLNASVVNNEAVLSWNAPLTGTPSAYQLWRLVPGFETDETAWALVSSSITAITATDPEWQYLEDGTYKWAVKAVYEGGNLSSAVFSKSLVKINPTPIIAVMPEAVMHNMATLENYQTEIIIHNSGNAVLNWDSTITDNRARNGSRLLDISLSPANGALGPDSTVVCTLSCNSDDAVGNYYYELNINSNDPDNPTVLVPITIEVYEAYTLVPDANFRMAINDALGQGSDYLPTIADLSSLTGFFDADNRGIQSLEGAQYLSNLSFLFIGHNQISDLWPISGLTGLSHLWLWGNNITDISPLAGLTNLSQLALHEGNQISSISPLAGMTNLVDLYLGDNQITDISPLAGMLGLTNLYLNGNQIQNISPLSGLNSLSNLQLPNNRISDISPLAGKTSLEVLYLDGNQISDISALSGLSGLGYLTLNNNIISDIMPLNGLISLVQLNLSNNPLSKESMLLSQSWTLPYVAADYSVLAPCYPSPSRDQELAAADGYLSWHGNYNYGTISYEIWLGNSPDLLLYQGISSATPDTVNGFSIPLNPGEEYYWRIKAIASADTVWSGMWHFTTTPHYSLEPQNVSAEYVDPSLSVNWQAPLDGLPESYQVWRLQPGQEYETASWVLVRGAVTETTCTDVSWQYVADGTYKWAVYARYGIDMLAGPSFSNELIKTSPQPEIYASEEAIFTSGMSGELIVVEMVIGNVGVAPLTWNSNLYQVFRDSNPASAFVSADSELTRDVGYSYFPTFGTIMPGDSQTLELLFNPDTSSISETYNFQLEIISNAANIDTLIIPISVEAYPVGPPVLDPPTNLTAFYDGTFLAVSLSWDAVIGATSYWIYRSESISTPMWSYVGESTVNTYMDSPGISYGAYYVTSSNGTAESAPSNIATVGRMQSVQANITIDTTQNAAVVSWLRSRDADGYFVYWSEDPYADFPSGWTGPISITETSFIETLADKRFYRVMARIPDRNQTRSAPDKSGQ